MLKKILGFLLLPFVAPIWFVVSLVAEFRVTAYYSFLAGKELGERKALTGKAFTQDDIVKLAKEMRADDEFLEQHRARHKGV